MKSFHGVRRVGVAAIATLIAAQACGGGDGITVTTPACTPVDLTFPSTVSGTTADCTSGGLRAKVYRFTSNPGFANGFLVSSAFQNVGIEVMSDPPGAYNHVWVDTDGDAIGEWQLPPGNFLVRVTSRTGSGTFDLEGYTSPLNTDGCVVRTLVVGVTLTNHSLEATDCEYADLDGTPDGTYLDAYVIRSSKPCTISMTSATMDTFLQIRNIDLDDILAGNDDASMGVTDSFLSLTECNFNDAPIVIFANTSTTVPNTGSYTLTVSITGGGSIVAGNTTATPITLSAARAASAAGTASVTKKAR
ncbi:MAG TPA: hypothetical protein VJR92_04690 [Gemmatimonadaceae bacterium]|nr:hypothetical protein [Gemmatimonadaceae bacterium]